MNKFTKLGIVTFSAVTLSAAVPTLVHAEENVAPQPNVAVKPNTAQPTPAPKPAENPQPEVKPAEQPQPAKPEKPAENPSASEKPTNPAKPEVKPAEQPQPTKPVEPAENVGLPKIPYRTNNPKRWFNGAGRPTLTTNDLAVPLPTDKPVENVYYVAPDGTLQALNFKQDTDKVTFETNHFSIYAMTFKVAASRDNGGTTTPVPVVNSNNTPTTTEQKGNDASSTKTQAEPLATKTETISKQVAKTLPNTGENNSILATLFGMLTLTAGLFSFRKESE